MADIDSSRIVLILIVGLTPIPSASLEACPGGPSMESMSMSAPPASSPPPKSSWAETRVTITAARQFRQNKLRRGERDILDTFTQTHNSRHISKDYDSTFLPLVVVMAQSYRNLVMSSAGAFLSLSLSQDVCGMWCPELLLRLTIVI